MLWGDYDNDNDLDLFVCGASLDGSVELVTLRNYLDSYPPNRPPGPPGGLNASTSGDRATLSWGPGSDLETPTPALTYSVRVGTRSGGVDIVSPMADADSGLLLRPAPGTVGSARSWTLRGLAPGTYYWSVQAVDASFKGSPFAEEGTFSIP